MVLEPPGSPSEQPREAVELAKCAGFCHPGDTVIVAYRDYDSPAKDLALKILTVRKGEMRYIGTAVLHCCAVPL